MYQKYTGIILKKHPIGEADEFLTIYTRERGKIRVKAISSRKISSRLAGSLQSLNEIELETAGRGNVPVLISVRLKTLNSYLREDLEKFAWALVGIETLYRITPDEDSNEDVYHQTVDFLTQLGATPYADFLTRSFQSRLLATLGYRLPITECRNCRGLVGEGAKFVILEAAAFCRNCEAEPGASIVLSREDVEQLKKLSEGTDGSVLRRAAGIVIDKFVEYILEREIKSTRFIATLN